MRRALGLHGSNKGGGGTSHGRTPQQRPDQARQRHRFVQDGGVPVVVLNHRTDESSVLKERITDLERLLETERGQHANCRRILQEANAAVQAMETRLVHAGLAHQEALNQERRAMAVARQALVEAQAQPAPRRARPAVEPVALPAAEPEQDPDPAAQPVSESKTVENTLSLHPAEGDAPVVKKRGRPRTRPLPEPKPVRWWTPSFRAKGKV